MESSSRAPIFTVDFFNKLDFMGTLNRDKLEEGRAKFDDNKYIPVKGGTISFKRLHYFSDVRQEIKPQDQAEEVVLFGPLDKGSYIIYTVLITKEDDCRCGVDFVNIASSTDLSHTLPKMEKATDCQFST